MRAMHRASHKWTDVRRRQLHRSVFDPLLSLFPGACFSSLTTNRSTPKKTPPIVYCPRHLPVTRRRRYCLKLASPRPQTIQFPVHASLTSSDSRQIPYHSNRDRYALLSYKNHIARIPRPRKCYTHI